MNQMKGRRYLVEQLKKAGAAASRSGKSPKMPTVRRHGIPARRTSAAVRSSARSLQIQADGQQGSLSHQSPRVKGSAWRRASNRHVASDSCGWQLGQDLEIERHLGY